MVTGNLQALTGKSAGMIRQHHPSSGIYDSVPNFEDFGLGCFLLAGSEVYKLK
jgi:hypothetical protein